MARGPGGQDPDRPCRALSRWGCLSYLDPHNSSPEPQLGLHTHDWDGGL